MRTSTLLLVGFVGALWAARAAFGQEIEAREVDYSHEGVALRGLLVYDKAVSGKRPAVLIFPEWWGRNDYARSRAEQLAQLGYAAFAVDMYGDARATTRAEEAQALTRPFYEDRTMMRERGAAALEALRGQDVVDGSKIAAIGYCFGGTCALELARSGADVKAVVSFHGGLKTPNAADAAQIRSKVLVCTGGADPLVPAPEREAFIEEMEAAGVDYRMEVYGGAKHSFTNPSADKAGLPPVAYQKEADRRSWESMTDFFADTLGK